MSLAISTACSGVSIASLKPGMVLTLAFAANFFEAILSPMAAMAACLGPMKMMPFSSQVRAKSSFSLKKP